eukprot:444299_1
MTETESKTTEVETNKENVKPEEVDTTEIETEKDKIKPNKKNVSKEEKNPENENENDIDFSEFTEDKILNDMKASIDDGSIGANTNCTKGQIRSLMSKKYNIDQQLLKKHKPYKNAWKRFKPIAALLVEEQQEEKEQEKEEENETEIKNKNSKKKK